MAKFGVLVFPRPGPLGVSDEEKRDVLKTLAERVVPHFK